MTKRALPTALTCGLVGNNGSVLERLGQVGVHLATTQCGSLRIQPAIFPERSLGSLHIPAFSVNAGSTAGIYDVSHAIGKPDMAANSHLNVNGRTALEHVAVHRNDAGVDPIQCHPVHGRSRARALVASLALHIVDEAVHPSQTRRRQERRPT